MEQWLEAARRVVESAHKRGIKEIFFQPLFRGEYVDLHYHKFKLDTEPYSELQQKVLRKSGVLRDVRGNWKDWGDEKPKDLYIHGVLMRFEYGMLDKHGAKLKGVKERTRFMALGASAPDGTEYHNQLNTLGLLHVRGFITPLPYAGWMNTKDVNKRYLENRLEFLCDSISKHRNIDGRLPMPVGLELFDCIGWSRKKQSK